jgi:hypothetical protein
MTVAKLVGMRISESAASLVAKTADGLVGMMDLMMVDQ